ncbi:hypothetical protein H0H81_001482 [Sphagnurus paluster]|uniref:Uncharacterized protein n=1 Tax=Sphagnurus paluster TaxID=117069 RepID=A0A9P7KIN3_9AGAR|nr:hypothetical protein H0H81_001482 [Sphagnurus paluster]
MSVHRLLPGDVGAHAHGPSLMVASTSDRPPVLPTALLPIATVSNAPYVPVPLSSIQFSLKALSVPASVLKEIARGTDSQTVDGYMYLYNIRFKFIKGNHISILDTEHGDYDPSNEDGHSEDGSIENDGTESRGRGNADTAILGDGEARRKRNFQADLKEAQRLLSAITNQAIQLLRDNPDEFADIQQLLDEAEEQGPSEYYGTRRTWLSYKALVGTKIPDELLD